MPARVGARIKRNPLHQDGTQNPNMAQHAEPASPPGGQEVSAGGFTACALGCWYSSSLLFSHIPVRSTSHTLHQRDGCTPAPWHRFLGAPKHCNPSKVQGDEGTSAPPPPPQLEGRRSLPVLCGVLVFRHHLWHVHGLVRRPWHRKGLLPLLVQRARGGHSAAERGRWGAMGSRLHHRGRQGGSWLRGGHRRGGRR